MGNLLHRANIWLEARKKFAEADRKAVEAVAASNSARDVLNVAAAQLLAASEWKDRPLVVIDVGDGLVVVIQRSPAGCGALGHGRGQGRLHRRHPDG